MIRQRENSSKDGSKKEPVSFQDSNVDAESRVDPHSTANQFKKMSGIIDYQTLPSDYTFDQSFAAGKNSAAFQNNGNPEPQRE